MRVCALIGSGGSPSIEIIFLVDVNNKLFYLCDQEYRNNLYINNNDLDPSILRELRTVRIKLLRWPPFGSSLFESSLFESSLFEFSTVNSCYNRI